MIEAAKLEADIYPAGPRGLSAYEIYKKEGGQLSEEEWLKSLNGLTPTIGENGNWFLGTVDTGLPSRGPKGDTGSIKFIVVTELPTENIDETAIYLKPVEKPTGENKFEELIYVNGKWEDLGTPNVEIDLSNYYTKEESNEKLLTKQDKLVAGDNIIIEGNVISASGGESIYEIRPTDLNLIAYMDKALVGEQITRMFTDGVEDPILRVRPTNVGRANITYYDFKLGRTDYPFSKKTQYYFMINPIINITGAPIKVWNTYLQIPYIYIDGSWDSDNKFTCTTIRYTEVFNKTVEDITTDDKVLTKTNTTSYTPTSDYHPATKKYVDDTMASVEEPYLLSLELQGVLNEYITNSEKLTGVSDLVNKIYNKQEKNPVIILKNTTYYYTSANAILYGASNFSIQTQNYTLQGYTYNFEYASGLTLTPKILTITGSWDNNVFTCTKIQYSTGTGFGSTYVLTKTNTTSYTPTKDYHPATKKYVDDQVGNINTVLATLTTVSEVTK